MAESKESVQGVVFKDSHDARNHGKGGIWYRYKENSLRRFPEDVNAVLINMPCDWPDGEKAIKGIPAEWSVDHKNKCGAQWSLTGTFDKPTLSPSLHWVGIWHGFLQEGYLRSC
jgi:hypothetical protein